jgi:DNA-binding transcriptional LysR family regulator
MDLKQLEYFRHVAELGSFTRAASFLSVVQPALSRQVRQLEIELGQSLFERNGRGVVLTAAACSSMHAAFSRRSDASGRTSRISATATRGMWRSGCRRVSADA